MRWMQLTLWTACLTLAAESYAAEAVLWRVAIVGDSTTTNAFLPAQQQWPHILERRLGIATHVLARPGLTMAPFASSGGAGGLVTAIGVLDELSPLSAAIILLGVNDWAHLPLENFRTAYSTFVAGAASTQVTVVCVTPLWTAQEDLVNAGGMTLEDYRQAIREVCADHVVVEGTSLIPNEPRMLSDLTHPNRVGTKYVARAMMGVLAQVIGVEHRLPIGR